MFEGGSYNGRVLDVVFGISFQMFFIVFQDSNFLKISQVTHVRINVHFPVIATSNLQPGYRGSWSSLNHFTRREINQQLMTIGNLGIYSLLSLYCIQIV